MTDFNAARMNMVESQVRPNGITDRRIIAAMETVPRELFVPEHLQAVAYVDEDISLGSMQKTKAPRALIEPMAFARLLQHAVIRPEDRVLVIGAGTGYGAAVIARIAGRVTALESDPGLAGEARRRLDSLPNLRVVEGPLAAGAPDLAPFDAILFEGRVEQVPEALLGQLAEGGRLVAVIGDAIVAKARVYTRTGHTVAMRDVFDASVAPLPGFEKNKPDFMF
jgi:protein-L-isoaspartate(D-aspartate) O-methyltransferase